MKAPALLAAIILALPAWAENSLLTQGIDEYTAGHYDKAIGILGAAAPTEFGNPKLHYYLGSAFVKINRKEDAIKQYKIALALEPEAQMITYCEQALRSLGVMAPLPKLPSSATRPGTEKAPQNQTPQIIAFMCGCPLCTRLEPFLVDVEKKYGQRISYQRAIRGAWLPDAATIAKHFQVSQCPTILYFDAAGNCTGQQTNVISQGDINRAAQKLYDSALAMKTATPLDTQRGSLRDQIMLDAQNKVNDAQKILDREVERINSLAHEDIANLPRRTAHIYSAEIHAEAQKRIQLLQREFDRRKQNIMAEAESRVKSVESKTRR